MRLAYNFLFVAFQLCMNAYVHWNVGFAADQVYGDEDMHSVVRQLCVDYMVILLCDCSYSNGVLRLHHWLHVSLSTSVYSIKAVDENN